MQLSPIPETGVKARKRSFMTVVAIVSHSFIFLAHPIKLEVNFNDSFISKENSTEHVQEKYLVFCAYGHIFFRMMSGFVVIKIG